ncbi:MAG TPA: crossover junction endodeoxyribonuclease RuvC [Candidatus Acidoferrales bacterium]|nr:crossover junction endodeoxyribonuclease RuvC [Candidatus Acidoferrales bacterium]
MPAKSENGANSHGNGRMALRVLGVDPAVAGATGYGVVELDSGGAGARMLRLGHLRFPARASFSARLREIHRMIAELVEEFAPDAVAVESVFTSLNMRTALKLAEVRGVILLAAAQADIPAHSYSPREVKASISGFGGASKQQMQQMVKAQLGLRQQPEPADAADALAVALCHAHAAQAAERFARSAALDSTGGRANGTSRTRASSRSHAAFARILNQ